MSEDFETFVNEEIYMELEANDYKDSARVDRSLAESIAESDNPFKVANMIKKVLKNYYKEDAIISVRFTKDYYKINRYYEDEE